LITHHIFSRFEEARRHGKKQIAMLLDPDKLEPRSLPKLCLRASASGIHYFFIGGSLLSTVRMEECIRILKKESPIPVVIFPGDETQISGQADALLLLSLISGRNPELLIGKHVQAAPHLRASGIEIIPAGYMLIESGRITTAHYMSNTLPIPHNKTDIAVNTAMAGEMLGLKILYLEAGSGADYAVSNEMVSAVKKATTLPLIVGGGIRTVEQAREKCSAGADIIVIGSALEENPELLEEVTAAVMSNHIM
jgi:putative glycerol-1-phosphate prenyltransferase